MKVIVFCSTPLEPWRDLLQAGTARRINHQSLIEERWTESSNGATFLISWLCIHPRSLKVSSLCERDYMETRDWIFIHYQKVSTTAIFRGSVSSYGVLRNQILQSCLRSKQRWRRPQTENHQLQVLQENHHVKWQQRRVRGVGGERLNATNFSHADNAQGCACSAKLKILPRSDESNNKRMCIYDHVCVKDY